jgi:HEAT repeat protein
VAIVIRCDECRRVYHVPEDGELTQITCSCGVTVPVPAATSATDSSTSASSQTGPPPETQPQPKRARSPEEVAALRRSALTIAATLLAGALVAIATGRVADLADPLWSVGLPRVPAWAWFAPPLAGLVILWLLRPRWRPDGLTGAAGLAVGAAASIGLLLMLNSLSLTWRPLVREVSATLTWAGIWPIIGAAGALISVQLAGLLERVVPSGRAGQAPPTEARIAAALTGAAAGVAANGGARLLPGLAMPGLANWTDPVALTGLAVLSALMGGAITVAALDFGHQHDAGRAPVGAAVCGLIAGILIEPLLALTGVAMLIAVFVVPLLGGLGGMATGLAVAAGGTARRVALAGLLLLAIGVGVVGSVYAPSPDAAKARMLIKQAAESTEGSRPALDQLREIDDSGAVASLAAGLRHQDRQVAIACAQALSEIDSYEARSKLLRVIDHPNRDVRRAAIRSLVRAKDERAVRPLMRMATGASRQFAAEGTRALAWLGEPAVEFLAELARSRDEVERERAISALGRLVGESERAREVVLDALDDDAARVRDRAVASLDELPHEQAFEHLTAALDDPDPEVREETVRGLAALEDPRTVDVLIEALHSGEETMARYAARGLGSIGTPEVVEALEEALQSDDPVTAEQAAHGLGYVGTEEAVTILRDILVADALAGYGGSVARSALMNKGEVDVGPLVPLLGHANEDVREDAQSLLSALLEDQAELIVPFLDHENPDTRARAIRLLAGREMNADPQVLLPLLADPDNRVRFAARNTLHRMAERAVPALSAGLTHEDDQVATTSAELLGLIDHERTLEPLKQALTRASKRPKVAAAAAEALGNKDLEEVSDALLGALRRGPAEVRTAAVRALGRLGASEFRDEFVEMLTSGTAPTRAAAAEALKGLADPDTIEPLVAALSDTNEAVRREAAAALGAIGEPAIDDLVPLLDSEDDWIYRGARSALRRIGSPEAKAALERDKEEREAESRDARPIIAPPSPPAPGTP